MKKTGFMLLMILAVQYVFAQGNLAEEKRMEFEAQKVAFFTTQLDLTPSEAAGFWPLYNEMQKKTRMLEENMWKSFREMNGAKGLKESDYGKSIEKMLGYEADMHEIKREYYKKMLAVIPASKLWKLGEAERKFHRQLFEKLRHTGVTPRK